METIGNNQSSINSQNTGVTTVLNSDPTNDLKKISTKDNLLSKYTPTRNIDLHKTPTRDMFTNLKETTNNVNKNAILPPFNSKQRINEDKYNQRKHLTSDKNASTSSFIGVTGNSTNSTNKFELKNQTRMKQIKLGNPLTLKSTAESKHGTGNYRYSSDSYSTSFCQALTTGDQTNTIETLHHEYNSNNPYSNYKNSVLKSSRESNKLKNLSSFQKSNSSSNKNESESQLEEIETNNNNNSPKSTLNFTDIFSKIHKIVNKTQKYSDQLILIIKNTNILKNTKDQLENALTKHSLFSEIENLQNETGELHVNIKRYNMDILNSFGNYESEQIYESTKFNTNLIQISSERRQAIYKKFFEICAGSLKDISNMLFTSNTPNTNKDKKSSITVTSSDSKIPIISKKSSGTNVNMNLNMNLNSMNNVSNISNLDFPNLKKMSRMLSKKQMSKNILNKIEDSIMEGLTESMMCEGVIINLPKNKSYFVNKPKEQNMNYKVYTDGDADDSDCGVDSEILDMIEDYYGDSYNNISNENGKMKKYKKIRSRSLLDLKKKRNVIDIDLDLASSIKDHKNCNFKKAQKQMINILNDVSISNV